jgi:hypothetical protein
MSTLLRTKPSTILCTIFLGEFTLWHWYLISEAKVVGFVAIIEVFERIHLLPIQGEPLASTLQAVCSILNCDSSSTQYKVCPTLSKLFVYNRHFGLRNEVFSSKLELARKGHLVRCFGEIYCLPTLRGRWRRYVRLGNSYRVNWLHTALMRGPRRSLSRQEGQKFLSLPAMNPCCPVAAPSHPDSIFYNTPAKCKRQPFVCLKAWFISSTFQLVLTELMPQLACQIGDTDGKQFAPVVIPLLFCL